MPPAKFVSYEFFSSPGSGHWGYIKVDTLLFLPANGARAIVLGGIDQPLPPMLATMSATNPLTNNGAGFLTEGLNLTVTHNYIGLRAVRNRLLNAPCFFFILV